MKGKYITTSVKLAVLSGSKRLKRMKAINAKPSLENFQVIWCKELSALQFRRARKQNMQEMYAM